MTNKERQAAYRARQKELGYEPRTFFLTEDEYFYIGRLIRTLRQFEGAIPATVRLPSGRFKEVDI